MLRISWNTLSKGNYEGLCRLAKWLGCFPIRRNGEGENAHRHRVVTAICRAEKKLTKQARVDMEPKKNTSKVTYVVMVGNLMDGFKPVGPFSSFDEASRWDDSAYDRNIRNGGGNWVMSVFSPDDFTG